VTERPLFSSVEGCGRFSVHVKPRASKTKVLGEKNGALEVAVAAPPVDGAANEELVRGLALHFAVAKSAVRLVKGDSSRTKLIEIVGLSEAVFMKAIERKP
jgi:uncharacterized protein (TIGR00251 family)